MRRQIYRVIEPQEQPYLPARAYTALSTVVTVASLVPLAFKETYPVFSVIEYVCVGFFILDYILRLITADLLLGLGKRSFLLYPTRPMAIIDLLSIIPSLPIFTGAFEFVRLFRLLRGLKVARAFRFIRYSKSFTIISRVFRKQKNVLSAVATVAVTYIIVAALVIYNVEPESFGSFFDAVYWATISLTTVGYGDIYPVTVAGRVVTMISSVLGIAVIALPSGVITAGYLEEIRKADREEQDCRPDNTQAESEDA